MSIGLSSIDLSNAILAVGIGWAAFRGIRSMQAGDLPAVIFWTGVMIVFAILTINDTGVVVNFASEDAA